MAQDLAPYRPQVRESYYQSLKNGQLARGSTISNFHPGGRLNSLCEAISEVLAERDFHTLNGFIANVYEGVYKTFAFARKPGARATGLIQIESTGHVADLEFQPFTIDLFGLQLRTLHTATVRVGETFTTVEGIAIDAGTAGNIQTGAIDTAEGRGTITISLPSGVRIWNPAPFDGGTQEESDDSRLKRFHAYIKSFGRSTKEGILSGTLSVPGIVAATVTANRNPYTGDIETGWVNVYITDGTASPDPAIVEEVRRTIVGVDGDANYPGYAAAGVDVYVGAIETFAIHVSYGITLIAGSLLDHADAIAAANAAVISYINRLPIGQDPLPDTISAKILNAHPDFYIVRLLAPTTKPNVPANAVPRVGGAGGTIDGVIDGYEIPT